jgi:outer membrane lipoprotein SlyB
MGRVPKVQDFKEVTARATSAFHRRSAVTVIVGISLMMVGIFLSGCANTYPARQITYAPVALAQPKAAVAESELLAVRIKPLDPGDIPEETRGLSKEIRKAEGYYAAVQIKKALQESGYWGPVRVVPADISGGEVTVTGRIVESDGEILKLAVRVQDATGKKWSETQYEEIVDLKQYGNSEHGGEVFRFLYTRVANDVAQSRDRLTRKDVDAIRQVAELRFAEDFAPDAFKGYLEGGETAKIGNTGLRMFATQPTTVTIVRLPASDDPTLASIRRIRVSEEGLIDTFDLQHETLVGKIADPYTQWRTARLKEMNAVRKIEGKRNEQVGKAVALGIGGVLLGAAIGAAGGGYCPSCASIGGAVAGVAAASSVQAVLQAQKQASDETEIHRAALEELGESASHDLKSTVVQVEGETVQLKGTGDEQFRQWRTILKQIHEREVGAPPSTN